MKINQPAIIDSVEVDATIGFLVPRIYRLLLQTDVHKQLARGKGIRLRHLLDKADDHEWKRIQDHVYQALDKRHGRIVKGQPIGINEIAAYDTNLAQSCVSRLVKDEFCPRAPHDLRIMEVATLALRNDQEHGTRQFRGFIKFLARLPEQPPRPADPRPRFITPDPNRK